MRIITVFSTETNERTEITTSATTWGALKEELKGKGLSVNNMKGMVKETKTTLESDGAILPTDTFTLFITPTKVKSGSPVSGPIKKAATKKAVKKVATKKATVKKVAAKKVATKKASTKKVAGKK